MELRWRCEEWVGLTRVRRDQAGPDIAGLELAAAVKLRAEPPMRFELVRHWLEGLRIAMNDTC